MKSLIFSTSILLVCLLFASPVLGQNRLAHLDEFCNPYHLDGDFPKLITPQWVGEDGVDAVIVLSIDDMRGYQKWESYLRPIVDLLKEIDGRAPVSIMTCKINPQEPHLQAWKKEGLSLEVHTIDHPCPCLQRGDFAKASGTYHDCVDLMASIPGNEPVAFRMPCCDSQNTPSPRFFTEVFDRPSKAGNFLRIDSSVFNVATPADKSLPRELVADAERNARFRKYLPFPSYVNTIENYPYP
ncbi:MAG: polysaccharide deacetylase family protein, partial [bacterium]|nr:polysaccharide deacetylase family protein [bacterium]